jgi:hypothetical protein
VGTARIARASGILILAFIVIGLIAPAAMAQSLECPTCGLEDVVDDTSGTVKDTVGDVTGGGGGGGGGSSEPLPGELDPTDDDFLGEDFLTGDVPDVVGEIVNPDKKKKKKRHPESNGPSTNSNPSTRSNVFFPDTGKIGVLAGREAAFSGYVVDQPPHKRQLSSASPSSAFNSGPLTLGELAKALGEAARQLAFPLGLALAVVAYLMVQGRIDAKDPKLALAALDAEEEYLSFQ